jgi:cold shock CspA family protein
MQLLNTYNSEPLQEGTVVRLNLDAGFGYVRDRKGSHQYIFVFGSALKRAQVKYLSVGKSVHFRVNGKGRVNELVVDERAPSYYSKFINKYCNK